MSDPRLTAVYDAENRWAADDDFFLSLAAETPRARVLDLGCGTGRVTVALAAAGHAVTGVDPDGAALAAGRAKPGAGSVTWVEGTSAALPDAAYDLALMTSHVAQEIVPDDEWAATLADLARAVVPGGRLAFDTRDPAARAWAGWDGAVATVGGVRVTTEVTDVAGGVVTFVRRFAFPDGDVLERAGRLRFRTADEVVASLAAAGFRVVAVYGGWQREPVGGGVGELVVVARR